MSNWDSDKLGQLARRFEQLAKKDAGLSALPGEFDCSKRTIERKLTELREAGEIDYYENYRPDPPQDDTEVGVSYSEISDNEANLVSIHRDVPKTYVLPLGDIHWGVPYVNDNKEMVDKLYGYREWALDNDALVVGMGDYIDNSTRDSVGAGVYEQILDPAEQIVDMTDFFRPLADRDLLLGLLTGNHECFDEETEVLTDKGWKGFNEISEDDKALTINEDGIKEWQQIESIHQYQYSGPMYHVTSSRVDMLLTPNHRVLYRTPVGNYLYKKIQDFNLNSTTRIHIPIAANNSNKSLGLISDDEIEVAAWALSDATLSKAGRFTFYQSGPDHKLITNLLDRLGWSYGTNGRRRDIKEICGKKLKKESKTNHEIYLHDPYNKILIDMINGDRYTLPPWISKLSKRQFDIFLNIFIIADGSVKKESETSRMIYTSNENLIDQFQELLPQYGYACTTSEYRPGEFRINICPRLTTALVGGGTLADYVKTKEYSGIVWCVTVPNGNFLARRNRKVYFTGNSRTHKRSGIDPTFMMSRDLDVPYLRYSAFLKIKVGGENYIIYVHHGSTGSRYLRTKMNAAEKAANTNVASIYCMGHVHELAAWNKEIREVDLRNKTVEQKTIHFVLTGHFLGYEGSYAEMKGLSPGKTGAARIRLSGEERDIHIST